jgi:TP901 family phage tail tape measure protein
MSDFLAEARILVRPDTSKFAAELQAQLRAVTAKPITIPVVAAVGATVGAAAVATGALSASQQAAQSSALGLTSAENILNTTLGRQAVILEGTTAATAGLATAQVAGAQAAKANAAANALSAANLTGARKGITATALELIGLRGATLSASGGFLAGAAASIAFGKSLSIFVDFERQLNVFQATAGATADEMQRVADTARVLGRDITLPGVSAGDAAEALTELARAGLSVQESLDAVRGTLQLATAAQIDNAQATELVANSLNAFRLPGSEAVRVADLLAAASSEAQGSIVDMGIALRQVSAVASGLGVSVEDTVTLLTQLARSGLSSSDAGTSLRTALLRLVQDMPKVNQQVRQLGLNLEDAQGNIRPEVFGELGRALQRLEPAERRSAEAALGGADAIRTYILLARDGPAVFEATRRAVTEQGKAQELAAAQTKGLGGDVEALKNEVSDLGLTLGTVAAGPVSVFVRGMTAATAAVNDFIDAADQTGVFESIGSAIGDIGTEFGRIGQLSRQGVSGADQQSSAFTRLDDITQNLTGHLGDLKDALKAAVDQLSAKHPEASRGLFLGPSEKLDIQAILAGGTEGLEDNIAAAKTRLARLTAELDDFHGNRNQFAAKVKEQAEAQADLNRLVNQQASQAQAAAKTAAAAARAEAAAAQQEFLARQQLNRDQQQNLIALAELTPGVKDDIRRQLELRALVQQQIKQIRLQITDRLAEAQAISALKAVLTQITSALKGLADQQKQLAEERRQALTDVLQKRLQLAELRGNKDAILAALNAAIADARKRVKAAKTLADRLDEQIALQELINQKNDLLKKKTEDGNKAARFFFEQLQAQQGFASNLLGNLIPAGQTSGLVGIPSPASAAALGATLPRQGFGPIEAGLGTAADAASGRSAVSPKAGQVATTNDILRRILHQLQVLTRSTESPEAIFQEKMGAAAMSGGGGNTDVM